MLLRSFFFSLLWLSASATSAKTSPIIYFDQDYYRVFDKRDAAYYVIVTPADTNDRYHKCFYITGELYWRGTKTKVASSALDEDLIDGSSVFYHKNGNRSRESVYVNGKEHGEVREYDEEGHLITKANYDDGTPDGLTTTYYANGKVETEIQYFDGNYEGMYKSWHENGQLAFACKYVGGKIQGDFISYHDNGRKRRHVFYDQGNREGADSSWYPSGALKSLDTYQQNKSIGNSLEYYEDGVIKSRENYVNDQFQGTQTNYYPNGKIHWEVRYVRGHKQGTFKVFYPNDTLRRMETYEEDSVSSGHCYDSTGKEVEYWPYEKMPEYPGGDMALNRFLAHNINYPARAIDQDGQGKVIIEFVVEKDGSVNEVHVVKGVMPCMDREAMRVVKAMPKWQPGTQDGEPVRVSYRVPIKFTLR